MANTARRKNYTDSNGNLYFPMNVEGGVAEENFFNTPKVICIAGIILVLVLIIFALTDKQAGIFLWIAALLLWFIPSSLLMRYVVFEEKFYYKMYIRLLENEITTPSMFWNIATIYDSMDGAIMTYSDGKIGIMVKIERDTITGKNLDFREQHYDSISDFYKELCRYNLSFVQMNIMERAGKDPRLNEIGKLVNKSDNKNINKLMELEVGYIKNITHATLYESDYFLIYTKDLTKMDTLVDESLECIYKLLDGAYCSYHILNQADIVDLVKEEYGVNYFNSTQASLSMFAENSGSRLKPFTISEILWKDGNKQHLTKQEINKIMIYTNQLASSHTQVTEINMKKLFYRFDKTDKVGVDFEELTGKKANITEPDDDEIIDI